MACALVQSGEAVQAKQRPRCTGGCQSESIEPVFPRFRHSPGQRMAELFGKATGSRIADAYPSRAGNIQADRVEQGMAVTGGLEVDQTSIGGTGFVNQDVVGLRVPVAQSEKRSRRIQLVKHGGELGCDRPGDGRS